MDLIILVPLCFVLKSPPSRSLLHCSSVRACGESMIWTHTDIQKHKSLHTQSRRTFAILLVVPPFQHLTTFSHAYPTSLFGKNQRCLAVWSLVLSSYGVSDGIHTPHPVCVVCSRTGAARAKCPAPSCCLRHPLWRVQCPSLCPTLNPAACPLMADSPRPHLRVSDPLRAILNKTKDQIWTVQSVTPK